jgi:two-component system chemotaxis sensor kinase CheA
MNDGSMDEFRRELLALTGTLERNLLALETNATEESIDEVFRAAHNIKSAALMLGLRTAADAAHEMESVLDRVRSGEEPLTQAMVTAMLSTVDLIRGTLSESTRKQSDGDVTSHGHERALTLDLEFSRDAPASGLDPLTLLRSLGDLGAIEELSVDDRDLPELAVLDATQFYLRFRVVLRTSAPRAEIEALFAFAEDHVRWSIEHDAVLVEPSASSGSLPRPDAALETILVPVRRVDGLVDLAAEVAIATGHWEQLRRAGIDGQDPRMENASLELRRLASRVQEAAMAIRLVPLASTFAMLRRFVRDQAVELGKEILVELRGEQCELDKSVAERLFDPLKHLVRNALDHGIETPEERRLAGKPARGRILLSARQEEGEMVLTVEDDGRGVHLERVRDTARERGLIQGDAQLSEEEALAMIFAPGFSTAARVGELSGRGVGLDIVRTNVEASGGELRVERIAGGGTRFSLCVPLSLAVFEGLVLRAGGERLIVPVSAVRVLVNSSTVRAHELPDGRRVVALSDQTIPVIDPAELFDFEQSQGAQQRLLVAVETGAGLVALEVDDVLSKESIMLKTLQRTLRFGDGLLGAAILGDGHPALVLDVNAVVTGGRMGTRARFSGAATSDDRPSPAMNSN